ncbi:MAG TPA: hypothetical protein VFK32_04435 [Tepidiformaceae bacterium]|nr:hypothetical protein [Tepidiformaceae bacterium]
MLTDNGLNIDPEAVDHILREADVITFAFALFPERLLVDTRTRPDEGALVAIVEPVTSVQERYMWLGQHRGAFGMPRNFSFIPWPHTVRALSEGGALAPLTARLAGTSALDALNNALDGLRTRERAAIRDISRGAAPWQTIYQRTA